MPHRFSHEIPLPGGAPCRKKVDLEKIAKLLDVQYQPPLDAGDIQSLNKSLLGYQAITDDTARFVEKHAQTLNLDPDVLAGLQQGLADVQRLEPAERLLETLRLSVYHQRLHATSTYMGAMLDTARRVRGIGYQWPIPTRRLPRKPNSGWIS
uniref:Uncharacterized protein n=1 Tax=Candidatus Kentrum sp. SD TaxID=2126332 RepID=A0A450Z1V6_9GAMM|nr:MAG: hypothetical protein BECKSD772F_GA0070984_11076 [Candidatus Kentron sp. SD]VFK47764.1 MAG: hypothetical protein BECKSD772E_GA0070983_11056 [Candidatus Kentron sp. SD]